MTSEGGVGGGGGGGASPNPEPLLLVVGRLRPFLEVAIHACDNPQPALLASQRFLETSIIDMRHSSVHGFQLDNDFIFFDFLCWLVMFDGCLL